MSYNITKSAKVAVKNIRVSPRKLNLVAALIRNMKVSEALMQLSFSKKRIAKVVHGALTSVVANAENGHGLNIDDLIVVSSTVGKSLTMKRVVFRARGRANKINKFFSNLYITVTEKGNK